MQVAKLPAASRSPQGAASSAAQDINRERYNLEVAVLAGVGQHSACARNEHGHRDFDL
jgi:hypothetical protein